MLSCAKTILFISVGKHVNHSGRRPLAASSTVFVQSTVLQAPESTIYRLFLDKLRTDPHYPMK